jgi:hypothetical protein
MKIGFDTMQEERGGGDLNPNLLRKQKIQVDTYLLV